MSLPRNDWEAKENMRDCNSPVWFVVTVTPATERERDVTQTNHRDLRSFVGLTTQSEDWMRRANCVLRGYMGLLDSR